MRPAYESKTAQSNLGRLIEELLYLFSKFFVVNQVNGTLWRVWVLLLDSLKGIKISIYLSCKDWICLKDSANENLEQRLYQIWWASSWIISSQMNNFLIFYVFLREEKIMLWRFLMVYSVPFSLVMQFQPPFCLEFQPFLAIF